MGIFDFWIIGLVGWRVVVMPVDRGIGWRGRGVRIFGVEFVVVDSDCLWVGVVGLCGVAVTEGLVEFCCVVESWFVSRSVWMSVKKRTCLEAGVVLSFVSLFDDLDVSC